MQDVERGSSFRKPLRLPKITNTNLPDTLSLHLTSPGSRSLVKAWPERAKGHRKHHTREAVGNDASEHRVVL